MFGFLRRKPEQRASAGGYTAQLMAMREAYIGGRSGVAELTATVQGCVTLWEGGLSLADVDGTDMLSRDTLAIAARSLALRGEALFLIQDRLVPASDWDLTTRMGKPTAYRLSVADTGGGRTRTALAREVLHFRTGSNPTAPYFGTSPLKRASLTSGLLEALEKSLAEVYDFAPIGSLIVPFPEAPETDLNKMAVGFRRKRGRVVIRESVNVSAAGGPAPTSDWKPNDLTPDMQRSMAKETLQMAAGSISMAYGVLPGLTNPATTGPLVREGQRHLAQWVLQPLAASIAAEASEKLETKVTLDVLRPLQAFDTGGRARAYLSVIKAMADAKEAGIDVSDALKLVDWQIDNGGNGG